MDGLGWVGDGPDVVGNGWDVMVKGLMLLGRYFSYTFSTDQSQNLKKYIKNTPPQQQSSVSSQAACSHFSERSTWPLGHQGLRVTAAGIRLSTWMV